MIIFLLFGAILLLVVCIVWLKINPFLAFLFTSIITGFMLGIPVHKILLAIQKGIGDTLGSIVIIIALGAMLGKIIADSGAAQKIADSLVFFFGKKYIVWALMLTGFIVGIPLFYGVGFVLMVPLIFSITNQYKLPAIATGLPLLAALSVTHGLLPPHPSPIALIALFKADTSKTLLYGIIISIPTLIIAGPLFSSTLKKIKSNSSATIAIAPLSFIKKPKTFISFFIALLPIAIIGTSTFCSFFLEEKTVFLFLADPVIAMLITITCATFFLGIQLKRSIASLMDSYAAAVKDVVMILLIIGGAGALKEIITQSNISNQIAEGLQTLHIEPLVLGWLIAGLIRICLGSATVAGITASGIMLPLVIHTGTNTSLMVLSIGSGSLLFSHVNDPGFWLFKEYFNVSIKDALKSWSLMETIVSIVGLMGVLCINAFV